MIINIVSTPAFPKPATQLRVDDGLVDLDVGANFQALLLDEDGNPVSQPVRVALTAAQYAAWIGPDSFVCNCVATNLGLTPIA